jgi:hypothetical protein
MSERHYRTAAEKRHIGELMLEHKGKWAEVCKAYNESLPQIFKFGKYVDAPQLDVTSGTHKTIAYGYRNKIKKD